MTLLETIHIQARLMWSKTIATEPCQECKHGHMKDDRSFRNDDCAALNSLHCPIVHEQVDALIDQLTVAVLEKDFDINAKGI
mgnify:CR=1 FL=1